MPAYAGRTTLAPLDLRRLGSENTRYLRDSGSVLCPTCPVRGITAHVRSLGTARPRSRPEACRSSPASKRPCRPCHRRAALNGSYQPLFCPKIAALFGQCLRCPRNESYWGSEPLIRRACPFRIIRVASYPWIVRCAAWISRNPCSAFTRCLIARRSCSEMLCDP